MRTLSISITGIRITVWTKNCFDRAIVRIWRIPSLHGSLECVKDLLTTMTVNGAIVFDGDYTIVLRHGFLSQ